MTELTYSGVPVTVTSGDNVPFNTAEHYGCTERYIAGTNKIVLTKVGRYLVSAGANVALPTTGTASTRIVLAITEDGDANNGATMDSTPTAVDTYNNVATQTIVEVYPCCCVTVGLKSTGVDALVQNQHLTAVRIGGGVYV